MVKKYGLRERQAIMIENLLKGSDVSLGANHIKDLLWDYWGRFAPTPRQIGTFLNIHPHMNKVKTTKHGSEYIWLE